MVSLVHQPSHHHQIEIHVDRYLGLTYFHTYGLFGMLYDRKIELHGNSSWKDNFDIFYQISNLLDSHDTLLDINLDLWIHQNKKYLIQKLIRKNLS